MTRGFPLLGAVAVCGAGALLVGAGLGHARDFGVEGQAFPVIEPDLLTTIEHRLKTAEASGELAAKNAEFAKRVRAKVVRPTPVSGISPAEEPRSWDYDPSITIDHDVRDHKGNLIAAAGTRVNPLDFVTVRQDLVFVDGDNAAEVAWATKRYSDLTAKIIFVSGSPFEAMRTMKRRFYFDQEGRLTGRFGIAHTPAIVSQAGKVMRVSEIVLKPERAS